ncbi:MAG: N-acetylmuramoyl-L-alanine amidase [Anaerolineaceae bacterium]|nr:N-acetylmuramoyl-L-alanine amidase [Anaerolineaceae bacterium]
MNMSDDFDPIEQQQPVNVGPENGEDPRQEPPKERPRQKKQAASKPFTLWRGMQTALAAAFVVATLFTIWTPGSLVEGSLESRMAQALRSASGDYEVLAEATAESAVDNGPKNIGIVAGHYGFDSGAVCSNGTTEAASNLEIATLVQKKLTDMGYTVDLLEEFDDRLDGYQAAVLISIHLDSCEYINDLATGYKVASALSDQNMATSQKLTTCLSEQYGEVTGLAYHAGSVTDDMTYYHAFAEINPQTPAAIIEAGFLNMDYQMITGNPELIADGIVAGLLCFLNN